MYDLSALTDELETLSEEKLRIFNQKLIPETGRRILGVRTPVLRRIARRISSGNVEDFLDASLGSGVHEINLLHAMVLAGARRRLGDPIGRLRAFVPTMDNWAVCDLLCGDWKASPAEIEAMEPMLNEYFFSEAEYECRFGAVMRMLYDQARPDSVLALYGRFRHEGYYARMGVAWGLSYLFVAHREETLAFLQSDSLDSFTHNKAIQKCVESYRVSDADKRLLRTLRR